jgi:hypothetical protein
MKNPSTRDFGTGRGIPETLLLYIAKLGIAKLGESKCDACTCNLFSLLLDGCNGFTERYRRDECGA